MISVKFIGGPADGKVLGFECSPENLPSNYFAADLSSSDSMGRLVTLAYNLKLWRCDDYEWFFYVLNGMDEAELSARVNREIKCRAP